MHPFWKIMAICVRTCQLMINAKENISPHIKLTAIAEKTGHIFLPPCKKLISESDWYYSMQVKRREREGRMCSERTSIVCNSSCNARVGYV